VLSVDVASRWPSPSMELVMGQEWLDDAVSCLFVSFSVHQEEAVCLFVDDLSVARIDQREGWLQGAKPAMDVPKDATDLMY
jgi:hypothetical protein